MLAQIRQSIRDPFRFSFLCFSLSLSPFLSPSSCPSLSSFISPREPRTYNARLESATSTGPGVDARIIVAVSLLADDRIILAPRAPASRPVDITPQEQCGFVLFFLRFLYLVFRAEDRGLYPFEIRRFIATRSAKVGYTVVLILRN